MKFRSNTRYPYLPGKLYLGKAPWIGFPVGIRSERHAITIAGAGAGKGSCLIIPNLRRWPHNALVIDPKGEAAEHTWRDRERMGQEVHVLDPFKKARVPKRIRASLNLLDEITVDSGTGREDINVLTDGLIMRHSPEAGHWDDGGKALLAGVIAHICDVASDRLRNLIEVRQIITAPEVVQEAFIEEMSHNPAFGSLPAAGAAQVLSTGKEAVHFHSIAKLNTAWLDSEPMAESLSSSSFRLSDLNSKPCTIFLVLPAEYLNEHSRFLRVFVRMAIDAMAKGGVHGGRQCLFILDEFFSLGYIDEIMKSAGLMRGYGVQLWPILQDLGQLIRLYGKEGAESFFGNADLQIYMGNTDPLTLDYVSKQTGIDSEEDAFGRRSKNFGQTRMNPQEVRKHVAKKQGNKVARRMIVIAPGDDILSVKPVPYFN